MSIVTPWLRWFAWVPVWVDAYEMNEIAPSGAMRYRRWLCWLERRYEVYEDEGSVWEGWRYRLPRRTPQDLGRNAQ